MSALWAMSRPAMAAPYEVDARLVAADIVGAASGTSTVSSQEGKPTHIEGDRIDGRSGVEMRASGNARLDRGDMHMNADSLSMDQVTDVVTADGNVRLIRQGDSITGPRAVLNIDTYYGDFFSPHYTLTRERQIKGSLSGAKREITASGDAEQLKFEGENQYRLSNATYSTCPAPNPDWYLRTSNLTLDFDRNQGVATGTSLWMKDAPLLWLPWAQFPLDGGRQSGFLPPTVGTANTTGFDISLPYYFNLAPNYDATLAPRWMATRGLQLSGEFRYLEPTYHGVLRGEYLPKDEVTEQSRNYVTLRHDYASNGWSGFVDVSNVSDKAYFSDLSTRINTTSTAVLSRQVTTNYSAGWWNFGFNTQTFQTLIGDTPYERLPQLTSRISLPDLHGFAFTMPSELTRFAHPTADEGTRLWAYPQLSYPMQWPAFFFTPKVGLHLTQYEIDRRTTTGPSNIGRAVPIMTLDSGLNFEREIQYKGKEQTQTLEPRLYYVRAPYRNQSQIPVFDSALADYNFGQIFSENRFSGNDRIGDSNQMTAALVSRLIETDSGEEWLRVGLGQRYHFADQRVVLPGDTAETRSNDNWLATLSGKVFDKTVADLSYEYNTSTNKTDRGTAGIRYTQEPGKVVSASYRYQTGTLRDIDLSAQWKLFGNYYGVGRYNYNMRDGRLTESLAGVEYNAGCWVLRFVWHSLLNTQQKHTNAFYIQLELDGVASLGSSPVQLLKRSVGGYQRFNGTATGDSFDE